MLFFFRQFPQIRVVNAFRQGLDARYGESLAEVLRKQPCFSKRLSAATGGGGSSSKTGGGGGTGTGGSIEYADSDNAIGVPHIDVERLSSHSHTETAV
ncbi:unnamed protein product [Macrosiphum euphorbiae]|uniref:Uncharacterized protein n=1 Tax=Macrosiphum euphorbiae TaxID=13131 RepID=A0AAV0WTC3_9HEMI|nr:unnamed protein product [Macrosiphum euphorbiae]